MQVYSTNRRTMCHRPVLADRMAMSSRSHPSQNCGEIVLQLSPDDSEWHGWEEIVLYEERRTVFTVYSKEVGEKIGKTSVVLRPPFAAEIARVCLMTSRDMRLGGLAWRQRQCGTCGLSRFTFTFPDRDSYVAIRSGDR